MFNTSQSIKDLGEEAKNKEREQGMQGMGGGGIGSFCLPTHFISGLCSKHGDIFKAITIVTVVIIYVYRFSLG